MHSRSWMVRIGLICGFALTLLNTAHAQCRPPKYAVAQNYIAPHGSAGNMVVSVDPGDVTVEHLVCLARTLKRQNPQWADVYVVMLDSPTAAEAFRPFKLGDWVGEWRWWEDDRHVRAVYLLDSSSREEYLQLTPLGWERESPTGDFGAKIDLVSGDDSHPRCEVAFAGRCLMALAAYRYPDELSDEKTFGTATLTGRITRSGKVGSIRQKGGTIGSAALVREAIENLQSWRFEPATREDALEITYSYVSDPYATSGLLNVRIDPSGRVTVRSGPTNPQRAR